jgi:hypothetical protein
MLKGVEIMKECGNCEYAFTPLNIYNGTTKGCPTRDLRATVTDKSIK